MESNPDLTAHYDVIIVGLGPTGAILANLLGRSGRRVLCLERDADIYYAPRAVHFDDEIMRIFQAVGLDREIATTSEPFTDIEFRLAPHGKPAMAGKLGSPDKCYGHAGAWWFHQPTLENILRSGLKRFASVHVVLGAAVTDLQEVDEEVRIAVRTADGSERYYRGRFVIGADGGRSTIRRLADLPLASAKFDEPWVVVDTKTVSGQRSPLLPTMHFQLCDPRQPVTYVPMGGSYYEWQFMVRDDRPEREATDPSHVRRLLKPFVDLSTIEIIRIAYYRFHALWATRWRRGNIVLAGDAAHQMPPFLGQGMCSGMRDAASLAWRLELLLDGRADPQILDDYELERNTHVQHIIRGAMFLGRTIQTRSRIVAFLRNVLVFWPCHQIGFFYRTFINHANRKRPLERGWIGRHHSGLAGALTIQPLVTRADGAKSLLDQVLGDGFALLARKGKVDASDPSIAALAERVPLRTVLFSAEADENSVGDSEMRLHDWFAKAGVDFVLVRPDRYIFDAGRRDKLSAVLGCATERFQSPRVVPLRIAA